MSKYFVLMLLRFWHCSSCGSIVFSPCLLLLGTTVHFHYKPTVALPATNFKSKSLHTQWSGQGFCYNFSGWNPWKKQFPSPLPDPPAQEFFSRVAAHRSSALRRWARNAGHQLMHALRFRDCSCNIFTRDISDA